MAKDIVFEIIPNEISKETVYFRLKDTILDNETIFHQRLILEISHVILNFSKPCNNVPPSRSPGTRLNAIEDEMIPRCN